MQGIYCMSEETELLFAQHNSNCSKYEKGSKTKKNVKHNSHLVLSDAYKLQ